MNQEIFDHIYSNLSDNDKNIIQLRLSGKKYQEIAQSISFDQSSVGRKLKAIAKKFKYSPESNLEWNEYLVQIFTQYKPNLVINQLQEDYGFHQVIMPGRPEKLDSHFYIERHRIKRCTIESECYEAIEQPGSLVRIKAPSRMGKTSLIKRIQDKANKNNYIPVYLRFDTLIEPDNINNISNFLKAFNKNIKSQLPDVDSGLNWDDNNAKISCTQAFKELLIHLQKNVVLLLDEVNEIFNYPEISKNFFAMLRSWYEESNNSEIWENLRMVIAYSTEYHGKLDIYQSPFNVGLPIELKEFKKEEVIRLILLHQLDPEIVTDLMSMVGGHPYLIRLALYKMSQEEMTIEKLLKEAPTDSGIYRDHLSRHLEIMGKRSKIKTVFQEILKANSPVNFSDKNREIRQLEAMGLITIEGNKAQTRCQLYRKYFGEFLG